MQYPFRAYRVTSPFGPRKDPLTGVETTHKGADNVPTDGDWNIRPMLPGDVKPTKYSTVWGNSVLVDHGGGVLSFYAHCAKVYVKAGDHVTEDTVIAYMGNTGRSTGAHLHFGVQIGGGTWVDPLNYVKERIGLEKTKVTYQGKNYEAVIEGDKTFVELRAFAAAFGCGVSYNFQTKESTVSGTVIDELQALARKYPKEE